MTESSFLFSQAERPLRDALTRLIEKPKWKMPCLVITHPKSGRFFQFSGSLSEPLTLDFPELDILAQDPTRNVDNAVAAATELLKEVFELRPEAVIVIHEFDQNAEAN